MKKVAIIILAFSAFTLNAQDKGKGQKSSNKPGTVKTAKVSYPGYEKSENGVYAKFYKRDKKGIKAKEGDVIKLILLYKNSKDSILFDSKKQNPSGGDFIEFPLNKSTFKGSFEDALCMLAVGDSASFLINADSVFLKTFGTKEVPAFIEKGSLLDFEVKLEKITSKEDAEKENIKKMEEKKAMMEALKKNEPAILTKYLADNKITATPSVNGLYYIEKAAGNGVKPTKGCKVKVNYTGRLLDGSIFDTSDEAVAKQAGLFDERRPYEPIEFSLGVGQVIPGWDEGISLMSIGAKGQLIIPSSIGYGEQGAGPIPPFSSLVFDVELISFTPAQ